jgi:hypothetical protein
MIYSVVDSLSDEKDCVQHLISEYDRVSVEILKNDINNFIKNHSIMNNPHFSNICSNLECRNAVSKYSYQTHIEILINLEYNPCIKLYIHSLHSYPNHHCVVELDKFIYSVHDIDILSFVHELVKKLNDPYDINFGNTLNTVSLNFQKIHDLTSKSINLEFTIKKEKHIEKEKYIRYIVENKVYKYLPYGPANVFFRITPTYNKNAKMVEVEFKSVSSLHPSDSIEYKQRKTTKILARNLHWGQISYDNI